MIKTVALCLLMLLTPTLLLADDFKPEAIAVSQVPRTFYELAVEFLYQGAFHIAIGWDHLAFVFCLCVISPKLKPLIFTISAFTLGHSLSMALAFLGLVRIPISPVEVIIAMSIVLMAREAWLQLDNHKAQQSPLRLNIVVIVFGLIHGLGFASALDAVGVLSEERVPALLFFNLGVELGQVAFVMVVSLLIALFSKVSQPIYLKKSMLIVCGSIACFWTLQRLSGF